MHQTLPLKRNLRFATISTIKIIIHSIFWIVYLLFSVLLSLAPDALNWYGVNQLLPHFVINLVWAVTIFYLSYFYLIKFFEKGKFLKYLFLSIVFSIATSVLFFAIHKLCFYKFDFFDLSFVLPPMAGTFIIAQCGSLVRGFENWVKNIRIKSEIENRNLRNELELLKSQINPHFLFNTLNNIDALISISPKDASASLITLSDMLRYMIYETRNDFVVLEKEIDYLKRYVTLQQLRYRKNDYVKVDFVNTNETMTVAPLLFLPFVENAFKYSCDYGTMPVIEIQLSIEDGKIIFKCENYFNPNNPQPSKMNGGVGLENVKRRLELLYPNKHNLQITKKENIFTSQLLIVNG